jgi:hypothetical protein
MARLELSNKVNKRSGIRITPIDPNERIGITPLEWSRELLQEQLNQFVGEPNTEITRAAIQSILWRYNFVYNEHLTIEDLNIF